MKAQFFVAAAILALLPQDKDKDNDKDKSAPKKLDSIAWIAGHWRSTAGGETTEELWLPPRGGMMLGLNRGVRGEKKATFEYLRIEGDAKGVVYLASPSGAKPTPFRLTEADDNRALFENPDHDFPKKIEYKLNGNKLTASIAGDKPGPSWTLERVSEIK
jgi:hypothetical protein